MIKKIAIWGLCIVCALGTVSCGKEEETASRGIEEISLRQTTVSPTSMPSDDGKQVKEDSKDKTDKKTKKKKIPKITSKGKIKSYGGTIMVDDAGFELYNYVDSYAKKYTDVVNQAAKKMKGDANVYDMVVPTSIGITLPDNKRDKVNSSNQKMAIQNIYRRLSKNVKGIALYDPLMQHRDEYIFFRTDHHWTALGAYYAYSEYCREKGWQEHELNEYKKMDFGGYLGSFYLDTNRSRALKKDKVKAYYPVMNKKIEMTYYNERGGKVRSSVICNATNYGTSLKYCAFIAGDNPFTVIRNKKIKNGSRALVVKESYGNAFVPYLTDHYQTVYVVDYRYWKGSVSKLVKEKNIQDVIFMNNISMTRNAYLIGKMAQIR